MNGGGIERRLYYDKRHHVRGNYSRDYLADDMHLPGRGFPYEK